MENCPICEKPMRCGGFGGGIISCDGCDFEELEEVVAKINRAIDLRIRKAMECSASPDKNENAGPA